MKRQGRDTPLFLRYQIHTIHHPFYVQLIHPKTLKTSSFQCDVQYTALKPRMSFHVVDAKLTTQ